MVNENSFITYSVTIMTILITLFVPFPIPENYRLIVIASILLFFLGLNLSNFNRRLEYQELEQSRLGEKLKIHEQLIEIRKEIAILKDRGKK